MVAESIRVGSLVMNCQDFDAMKSFWEQALGYATGPGADPGPRPHRFSVLRDPTGTGPNVSIDEGEPERGQLHLDLYSVVPEQDVQRLIGLGATLYRERKKGEDFTVLADPEGNLFCVVDAREE
jgi:catechol 2,3-dioxygenase-like lactoylglutathione lyase family enzyme